MNWNIRTGKAVFAGLGVVAICVAGTAFYWRSPSTTNAHKVELVGVVSAAAPPQEAAKPKPAPVVGGGQFSPNVGQTYPNRVYWGVAHIALVLSLFAFMLWGASRLTPTNQQRLTILEYLPPYVIGSVAMFWVIQRIAAF